MTDTPILPDLDEIARKHSDDIKTPLSLAEIAQQRGGELVGQYLSCSDGHASGDQIIFSRLIEAVELKRGRVGFSITDALGRKTTCWFDADRYPPVDMKMPGDIWLSDPNDRKLVWTIYMFPLKIIEA